MLSRYRNYLQQYYQNSLKLQDDKLGIAPTSEFINLVLVNDDASQNTPGTIISKSRVSENVAPCRNPLEMDSIIVADSKFVLVEGGPGMGKSTLCLELCKKWDTLKSLRDYKIVLLLKLRERRVQNATSLCDIFYHYQEELRKGVVDEVCSCEGEGVLLVLDGFDEMPTATPQDSLIMRLIGGECLPAATRLLTSRPSALHHKLPSQKSRHVEIHGFTDECKEKYAHSAFSQPDLVKHFKDFISSNPIINSLMDIPINCAIVAQVYKDIVRSSGPDHLPKTMTQLYTTLVRVLIKRYMIEKGRWNETSRVPSRLQDLPLDVVAALDKVSGIAHGGLLKEDVQLIFTESDVGRDFQHLGLLRETKELYTCEGATSTYSFLHLSIQEFLAAWHVSHHLELVSSAMSCGRRIQLYLKAFGLFLAGLIGCDDYIIEEEYLMYIVNCLYEAQGCSCLSKQPLPKYTLFPQSRIDMYAFQYLLANAPIEWHLTLDFLHPLALDALDGSTANVLGSVVKLIAYVYCGEMLSRLPLCPLLKHVRELEFEGCHGPLKFINCTKVLQILPAILDVEKVTVCDHCSISGVDCDDYLLYQSLNSLSKLQVLNITVGTITEKGMNVLSRTISGLQALQQFKFHYWEDRMELNQECLCRLTEAILSHPSVSIIDTNMPLLNTQFKVTAPLQEVVLDIDQPLLDLNSKIVFNCLYSIADACSLPSMQSLTITHPRSGQHKEECYEDSIEKFITILNRSLYRNPFMTRLDLNSPI